MANKREFKKYVDAVGGSICEELMATYYNVEGADKDKIAKAIELVLGAVGIAKSNSNVFFDRGIKSFENHEDYSKAKHGFFSALFKKINSDFAGTVDEAIRLLNESIPESVKEVNKQSAN